MLFWAFNQALQSQYLRGVNQQYGTLQDTPLLSAPAIVWVPTTDIYADPAGNRLLEEEIVTDGVDKHMNQFNRRSAGCELRLYVTGNTQEAYPKLEDLINRTANALRDLGVHNNQNAYPVSGRYLDRAEVSDNTVGYAMQIEVVVPLYFTTPIYPVEHLVLTTTPETPL
jgi:hypothetical protein